MECRGLAENFNSWIPLSDLHNNMKDFYVYLHSNTAFSHENIASRYVTTLAKELTFGSDCKCCLKEIHYPRSWNTLDRHERNQNTWETKTLPPGHYERKQQVIDAMNKLLSELMVTLELLNTSQNVVIIGIGLFRATNLTHGARTPYRIPSRSPNMNRGIDAIYVYYDVIQTKLVGDSSMPLLSAVPLRGVFGEMVFKEYSSPVYTPCVFHN